MSFVVTSSQMHTKHLPLPGYAGSGAIFERPSPVTAPTASTPSGSSVGTKTPSPSSYSTRAPACARSEYAGCRPPEATSRSQSKLSPSRTSRRTRPLPPCAASSRGRVSRRSIAFAISMPTFSSSSAIAMRLVVRPEHDRPLAGLDREVADESANAVGEHHADEVVPREDERLLGRARRDDDPLGAEAIEGRVGIHRNETPLPDPEGACRREHLDAVERQRGVPRVLVDEDDSRAGLRRLERCRTTGLAASDDEHARAAVLRVVAARVTRVRIELPEPGRAAQELLVERPGGAWSDERAVVEADRRERAAELVGHGHEVEIERPADVLPLDDGAFADRLGADAHVRHAVDGHLAVRTVARAAEEAARPVVLEGAREDALARGERRRRDRVALEAGDLPAREGERDRLRAVDSLAGSGIEPHAGFLDSGSITSSTSFVRVSRSARNHSPQPARCCHHSRCTPATLSRKYT